MISDPLDDVVAHQYEQWMYPAPIWDLTQWLHGQWQWFDPSHAHRLFWPDRAYPEGLDILVAGCGTNQAAVIAYTNPTARVVAVDVSDASLAHHRYLVERHGLNNLELRRMPIERVGELERDFDLIISTGVLHHMDDPQAGALALAQRLRPDGVMALMLYATYGRIGVQMLQSAFRDMALTQDAASIALVKDALANIDPMHPIVGYIGIAPDLQDDAGVVDTFLHGRDRTYTIDECRELVAAAGLVFQDLFLKAPYYAPRSSDSAFLTAVAALPRERQWSVMERVNPRNACHYFLACRPERSRRAYEVDFDAPHATDYVPSLRLACRLEGDVLHRHDGWQLRLDTETAALLRAVDGRTSIDGVIDRAIAHGADSAGDRAALTTRALEMFRTLWQLDFLALGTELLVGGAATTA